MKQCMCRHEYYDSPSEYSAAVVNSEFFTDAISCFSRSESKRCQPAMRTFVQFSPTGKFIQSWIEIGKNYNDPS
jgi:hypothetical protein